MTFLKMASRETAAQELLWRIVAVRGRLSEKGCCNQASKALTTELDRLLSEYSILCDLRSPITQEIEDLAAKVHHVYSLSIQPRPLISKKPKPRLLRIILSIWGKK
jgi:hypothetical protein